MRRQWEPGEIDAAHLNIHDDGTFDEQCDVCGRYLSAHDPERPACSEPRRRWTPKFPSFGPYVDPLVSLPTHRQSFAKLRAAWPDHSEIRYHAYGTALRSAIRPSAGMAALAMCERAIQCDLAARDAVSAWRRAAA